MKFDLDSPDLCAGWEVRATLATSSWRAGALRQPSLK
jgi:hypothetical protein